MGNLWIALQHHGFTMFVQGGFSIFIGKENLMM
jgi:hypothetical protein